MLRFLLFVGSIEFEARTNYFKHRINCIKAFESLFQCKFTKDNCLKFSINTSNLVNGFSYNILKTIIEEEKKRLTYLDLEIYEIDYLSHTCKKTTFRLWKEKVAHGYSKKLVIFTF